jgi:hypothetical protein
VARRKKVHVNAELVEPDKGFVCEECLQAGSEGALRRGFDFAFRLEAGDREAAKEGFLGSCLRIGFACVEV